jgi:ABC-2 type transport system ATP-binding protein
VQHPGIEAMDLVKAYGQHLVLNGVDLVVPRGSVFALLGPNGAGKTTTIRILSTLTRADSGRARVAGFDVTSQRSQVRRRISLTGQFAAIDELQTGRENLAMMGRLRGLGHRLARDHATNLLRRFDLTDSADRRVSTYSGGMRRRLDIAAGLVTDPEVVFLDEPTAGLDPRSRQAMWDVVTELASTGVTIFMTTQYLEEADRLADRIAVIDGGQVVAQGTAQELKAQVAGKRLDLVAVDDDAFEALHTAAGTRVVHVDRTAFTIGIATDAEAKSVRAVLDELDPTHELIAHFSVHSASLDDVFMVLTGQHTPGLQKEAANV